MVTGYKLPNSSVVWSLVVHQFLLNRGSSVQTMPTNTSPFVYGGVAAVCAEMITFPVDTAKTRLQLQGQIRDKRWEKVRYRGTLHCIASIMKEEGVTSVYKGLSPAMLRQAVYGTIKFGLYYSTKELVLRSGRKESCLTNLGCAVLAGSVSSAIATPTDLIKVRMQSYGVGGVYSMVRNIKNTEGVVGLWRGVCPTAQRAALVAGVQLPVYDCTKAWLCNGPSPPMKDGVMCHLLSSILSATCAALVSNPVDVVRTRLMMERGAGVALYRSSLHCGLQTVTTEGVTALYRGLVPAFARMGPWNITFFLVYEKLKRFNV